MQKLKFLFLTAIATLLIAVSCKKDDTASTPSIIGKWKMSGYRHNGANVFGTAVGSCIIDNIITFTSTQLSVDEGATKCSASDPQTITGTYSLNAAKTQLTTSIDSSSEINDILLLDAATLKLRQTSNADTITYSRQP